MQSTENISRLMWPLYQAAEGGSNPTSVLSSCKQLLVSEMDYDQAKELNRLWHSRLPRMGTGFIENMPFLSFGAEFAGVIYAVAIWSNPVAMNLPQQSWLELRRLAIAPDAPKNTASRMLRVMAIWIRRKRPEIENLISYQDMEVHTGTIYKAAGWRPTTVNKNGNWDRPNRSRPKAQSEAAKQRWEFPLVRGVGSQTFRIQSTDTREASGGE